jgi:hypothetical protein
VRVAVLLGVGLGWVYLLHCVGSVFWFTTARVGWAVMCWDTGMALWIFWGSACLVCLGYSLAISGE